MVTWEEGEADARLRGVIRDEPSEATVRKQERERIARHMKSAANELLRCKESDAIDGYVAAVILDLADTIERNGEVRVKSPRRE